jgi:hypothetical protein
MVGPGTNFSGNPGGFNGRRNTGRSLSPRFSKPKFTRETLFKEKKPCSGLIQYGPANRSPMIPEPTTAATRNVVPRNSDAIRAFSAFIDGLCLQSASLWQDCRGWIGGDTKTD